MLQNAVKDCLSNEISYVKFISANDAGSTGSHQSGFYIAKNAWRILFDSPGSKGENKEKRVTIKWQQDFETESRFVYYGQGSRNEYRITRFGRGFPFLNEEHVGDLFVLVQVEETFYNAYILSGDEEIEEFFLEIGMDVTQTNSIIEKGDISTEPSIDELFQKYLEELTVDFPDTKEISRKAREISGVFYNIRKNDPDKLLLNWVETEYSLFRAIESSRYRERISTPFNSVEELVGCANTLLNRRKSRAGKSLENHLSRIFKDHQLNFEEQAVTEGRKKPDFLFPGSIDYHNSSVSSDKLTFLAAKTTCKDRWRQVLNEADKIEEKHLFTLQQGISENQLKEMYDYKVRLVVPKSYITSFPKEYRDKIMSLESFITHVKNK